MPRMQWIVITCPCHWYFLQAHKSEIFLTFLRFKSTLCMRTPWCLSVLNHQRSQNWIVHSGLKYLYVPMFFHLSTSLSISNKPTSPIVMLVDLMFVDDVLWQIINPLPPRHEWRRSMTQKQGGLFWPIQVYHITVFLKFMINLWIQDVAVLWPKWFSTMFYSNFFLEIPCLEFNQNLQILCLW